MATGCCPPSEVTKIRETSGGMLRAHVNPWQLPHPLDAGAVHPGWEEEAVGQWCECTKLGGGSYSEPRFIALPSAIFTPAHETRDKWSAVPSLFLVCKCREASGFLESKMSLCTKGHTLGFHHQHWECLSARPCPTAQVTGWDTKGAL